MLGYIDFLWNLPVIGPLPSLAVLFGIGLALLVIGILCRKRVVWITGIVVMVLAAVWAAAVAALLFLAI